MLYTQKNESRFNPNISVVGDLRLNYDKKLDKPVDFAFYGLELVIENYLNPFSRADMTIHFSDDEKVDIEEAYITVLKGLPFNSQMRIGRYFLPFGQIQTKHRHVFAYFDYPEMHQAYFGEEGVRNIGVELNFAFPIFDQFTELKLNILEGNMIPESHEEEEHEEEGDHSKTPDLAFGLHYSIFTELSDFSHLNTSFSYFNASADMARKEEIDIYAITTKFKWKPSDYQFFQLSTELFFNKRYVIDDKGLRRKVKNSGYFIEANYQFSQKYNLGSYYNMFRDPVSDKKIKAISAFAGFFPMEESLGFRLKFSQNITNKSRKIELQAVFSLGPHKTHSF